MSTGYGRDLSCRSTLSTGRLVTGATLLAEAIVRRLSTPRGTLSYDPQYGFDVSAFIGAASDVVITTALPTMVENELLKDDRIASVEATVTHTRDASGAVHVVLALRVRPAEAVDDFDLTLAISDAVSVIGALP